MKLLLLSLVFLLAIAAFLYTPDKSLFDLETRYLRAPSAMVDLLGTPLRIREEGPRDAPAVILLHGFGSSLESFDAWAKALATSNRVIRIDLPGHGLSGPDLSGDYSDQRSIALLVALMDQLGLERAAIIGNSIGGRIAFTLAATHPSRISKLVLVSPDGFASPGFAYGEPPEISFMLDAMEHALPKALLKPNLAAAFADPTKLTPEMVDRTHDLMLAPGNRRALLTRLKTTVLNDPRPLLARIEAPVLLLWGERDAMIPLANAQDYLAVLPDARLVTLPGVGHVPQEEAPAQSLAPVEAFLAG